MFILLLDKIILSLNYRRLMNIQLINILIAMIKPKTIIIELIILVGVHSVCWNNEPSTRTGNIIPITVLSNSSTNVLSVTTGFTSSLATLMDLKTGLGLIGYQSYLTSTFSFNTTVGNVDLTSISVIVQPKDNTYLINIKLRYIVIELTIPRMDLLMACFKCMNISLGWGPRNQTFESQGVAGMSNSSTLKIRSFFYAFNFTNLMGTKNYLQVNTFHNTTNYTHLVKTSDNTTVDFICLTTLVWETSLDTPGAGLASIFETYYINSSIQTSSIKYYPAFDCDNLRFFGLSMIHHSMGGERLFTVYPQNYLLTNSTFTFNSFFIGATLEVIYIGFLNSSATNQVYNPVTMSSQINCTGNTTANVSNVCTPCASQCKTCDPFDANICTSCNFNATRGGSSCSCLTGYYQVNASSACVRCNSSIPYCSTCQNGSYCLTCYSPSPTNISGKCYCNSSNSSYIVNNVCLSFPGCILAQFATNQNYCDDCDGSRGFELDSTTNKTCRCKYGFNNSADPNICLTICGNGNVTGKACDDGDLNTGHNDGCTNCTVDPGYYCYVVANTSGPSYCIPKNSSASITYLYAERISGTNQAKLYFTSYPLNLAIPSNTFAGHISSNASYDMLTASYDQSSSIITVTIQFTKNMEGNNYNFTFNYSALTTFYSDPITVNVVTTGINQQLILLSLNMVVKTMKYAVIGISIIGILLALISTIAGYKLMGLQLILPLQAIYFTQLTMQNPPPYLSELTSLSYSNGFNQVFPYNFYNYNQQTSKLPKFLYSVEYGLNVNIMVGFLLISTIVLIIFQIIYLCHNAKTKSQQVEQEQQVKINKKNVKEKKQEVPPQEKLEDEQLLLKQKSARERRNTYLNHFYFTAAMILVQQCIFSFLVDNSQLKVGAEVLGGEINLLLSYISMTIVVPNLIYLFDQYTQKKEKRALTFHQSGRYKYPVLLIFSYVLLAIILGTTFTYSFALYAALAISVLPLIILIVMKPYAKSPFTICIISAIADKIMLIVAVSVYLVNSIMTLSQLGWLVSVALIICLIAISQGLTIVRMIKVIPWKELELIQRCLQKKDNTRQRANRGKAEKEKLLDRKPEIQMTDQIKNSLITGDNKMLDWEQRNSKEYNSIKSGKPNKQDDQHENSEESEEDELLLLKRRLKKQITNKRSKI